MKVGRWVGCERKGFMKLEGRLHEKKKKWEESRVEFLRIGSKMRCTEEGYTVDQMSLLGSSVVECMGVRGDEGKGDKMSVRVGEPQGESQYLLVQLVHPVVHEEGLV